MTTPSIYSSGYCSTLWPVTKPEVGPGTEREDERLGVTDVESLPDSCEWSLLPTLLRYTPRTVSIEVETYGGGGYHVGGPKVVP